ncbi:helix-turn-helix transcriptional regulator [Fredinandcohnia sp. QZ13]|uniref:helix-turn-helix domain-containing protein n=1 Tax=Fredinandcohnia sp. QZ13 TaxID=3073144 RepID=UPI0028533B36|nr:helix-turn-helix transcriptional regulator [Fredinandcohnia sp. QZ13]MDR4886827.1 helix-turn-helix transcriptional regulator [Fredinandcohnia sp. QZ13]
MLGERIRKLRKQKKLTLEELAGTKLTKGMLSLIENNKANPSMESLNYIAERLEIDLSQLLNEDNLDELRKVIDEAEKLYMLDYEEHPEKYKKLLTLIEPYVSQLNQGYEAARLLELYGYSCYFEKKGDEKQPLEQAANLYDQMNITTKRVSIASFRCLAYFINHDYEQALETILQERQEIERNHAYIDPMSRLDLDYNEASFYFAVGNTEAAKQVMEDAISFSQKNKIFYRIDDLYRLAAADSLMSEKWEQYDYYLTKLNQYADFSDDQMAKVTAKLFQIESLNAVKHDYQGALTMVDQFLDDPEFNQQRLREWFYLEKGKALHGLKRYEESIHFFDIVVVPSYHHHPFDLSQFYLKETYTAQCLVELGKIDEALLAAKKAVELFDHLPDSPFKEFSKETFHKICSLKGETHD